MPRLRKLVVQFVEEKIRGVGLLLNCVWITITKRINFAAFYVIIAILLLDISKMIKHGF